MRRLGQGQPTKHRKVVSKKLTGSGAIATTAMSTGRLHYLVPPGQRVPVLDASRYGTPPLSVRAFVTHAAIPATFELFKVAILQWTIDIC